MNTDDVLNKKVSFQKDTWSSLSKEMTINDVLLEIKSDSHKFIIERLREFISNDNLEAYKAEKLKLPAVTFGATFDSNRRRESIKTYNSIIVLDIDKLDSNELNRAKSVLANSEFVLTFWTSPSNNGLKGLVSVCYEFDINSNVDNAHKSAFLKLKKHFYEIHNITLDGSGNDTTRLCFLSFDKELVIKNKFTEFSISENDLNVVYINQEEEDKIKKTKRSNKRDALFNPTGKNKNYNRKDIKQFINFLTKKKISITDEYENRYRIGYAISNSFTYDIGLKYFLAICILDKNYNEIKSIKLLEYCYENNTGWTKFKFIEEKLKEIGYYKKMEKVVSQ